MQTGTHGPYDWLETDHDLSEFLSICPTALIGRYIAITAVDSGCFCPSEQDRAAGWNATGGIAYSPRLESIAMLPPDCYCDRFDEWYIFETEPTPFGSICHANVFETAIAAPNVFQFINFYGFQLADLQMTLTDLFWAQMQWVHPESYVGNGHRCLVFASSNREVFANVRTVLSRTPSRSAD